MIGCPDPPIGEESPVLRSNPASPPKMKIIFFWQNIAKQTKNAITAKKKLVKLMKIVEEKTDSSLAGLKRRKPKQSGVGLDSLAKR